MRRSCRGRKQKKKTYSTSKHCVCVIHGSNTLLVELIMFVIELRVKRTETIEYFFRVFFSTILRSFDDNRLETNR